MASTADDGSPPAPAVARQTAHVLQQRELSAPPLQQGVLECFTSGDPQHYAALAGQLLTQACPVASVEWVADELVMDTTTSFRLI